MNNNSSKQILLSVIGVAILVIAVVGVSFAFFSYVYNGDNTANTVNTGTIVFEASDTNLTLTNAFPTKSTDRDYAKHSASSTVSISGNTTYENGIAFTVRAYDVAYANEDIVPTVTVTPNTTVNGVVFEEGTYDVAKEYNPETPLVDGIISKGIIEGNKNVPSTAILTINAYYDMDDYHISDSSRADLNSAGLLPTSYAGEVIGTDVWEALSKDGATAFSFKIQVTAVENGDEDPRFEVQP